MKNSKSETLNSKQTQNSNSKNSKIFVILSVLDFEFRILDLFGAWNLVLKFIEMCASGTEISISFVRTASKFQQIS